MDRCGSHRLFIVQLRYAVTEQACRLESEQQPRSIDSCCVLTNDFAHIAPRFPEPLQTHKILDDATHKGKFSIFVFPPENFAPNLVAREGRLANAKSRSTAAQNFIYPFASAGALIFRSELQLKHRRFSVELRCSQFSQLYWNSEATEPILNRSFETTTL